MRKNISAKYIITTREYIENYLGIPCNLRGYISHERMEEFVMEKGKRMPFSINFKYIDIEDILRGNYVMVRSEGSKKKKNAPLRIYPNPHRKEPVYLGTIDHQLPEEYSEKKEEKHVFQKVRK